MAAMTSYATHTYKNFLVYWPWDTDIRGFSAFSIQSSFCLAISTCRWFSPPPYKVQSFRHPFFRMTQGTENQKGQSCVKLMLKLSEGLITLTGQASLTSLCKSEEERTKTWNWHFICLGDFSILPSLKIWRSMLPQAINSHLFLNSSILQVWFAQTLNSLFSCLWARFESADKYLKGFPSLVDSP